MSEPYLGLQFDPTNQIRVLRVQPSSDLDADVCVTVFVVTLDDPTHEAYNALSYCWGSESDRRNIIVSGNEVSVTYSLASALKHLRKDSEELSIWADALCINQDDVVEKEIQVMMMDKVYTQAEKVFVWLGVADADSDLGMDTCNEWGARTIGSEIYSEQDDSQQNDTQEENAQGDVAQGGNAQRNDAQDVRADGSNAQGVVVEVDENSTSYPNHRFILSQLVDNNLENDTRGEWRAVQRLLDRPYWERLWIYQEVQLAQKVIIRCGNKEVAWEHFAGLNIASSEIYRKKVLLELGMSSNNREMVSESGIDRLNMFFDHALTGLKRQEEKFYHIVRRTANQICGNQRDRMYAILSLSKDWCVYPKPAYKETVAEIYTQYAIAFIQQYKTLEWLNEASCRKHEDPELSSDESHWPSWVPNWKAPPRNEIVLRKHGDIADWYYASRMLDAFGGNPVREAGIQDQDEEMDEKGVGDAQANSKTRATTEYKAAEIIDKAASIIRPLGFKYDTIADFKSRPFHKMGYDEIMRFVIEGKKRGKWDYYPNDLPLFNVLFRTSLMGIYPVSLGFNSIWKIDEHHFTDGLAQGFLLQVACDFGFLLEIPPEMSGLSLESGFGGIQTARYVWNTPMREFDFRFWNEDTMRTVRGEKETSKFFKNPPKNYGEFATFQSFVAARRNDTKEERDRDYGFLIRHWRTRVRDATKGRTLFRTKGGLIGLATHSDLRNGDLVTVLFGGKTPFILRQVSTLDYGTYQELVTDAYIYGLMDGEAVVRAIQPKPDDKNAPPLMQFTIR